MPWPGVGLQNKARVLAGSLTLPDRKMLELARAIAVRPRLLLLDESWPACAPPKAIGLSRSSAR